MKFALAKEHRDFFAHNHCIEFEDLLSPEEVTLLNKKIISTLKTRNRSLDCARDYYLAGRDLWRDDLFIQNIVLKRTLATIAADLFKQPVLRLCFDQYQQETFPLSLEQMSSLTPVVGAIAIPLENNLGRVIYFSASKPLLFSYFEGPVLVIAYSENKMQYIFKQEDLLTHAVKKLGYCFGDFIRNETHPIVIR